MKLKYLALAVALGLALPGCSLIPEFNQPQAPIDSAWPQGPAYGAQTDTAATSLLWKDFFRDPKMQQLIGVALENNRDLRVAALNVQAYRAQYRIQRSELFPSIDANASGSRQRLPADLATTGQPGIQSQYGLDVGISSYELDVFGRVRSLTSAALETYLATEQAQNSIRIGLIADVASAYLTWQTDQELLKVTANTLASYTKSLGMIESSQREGTSSALDVRQARTLVDSARAQKILYTRQVAQDANALQLLLGANIPSDQVNGLALNAVLLRDIPAGLPSDLLQKRPDIQEAEHRLLAANANIGAARAAFFPSISLTATAGSASSQLGDLLKGGQGSWSFVPQINVPIFNGGRLRANLDYATIQKDIGVAQYEKSIQTAFQEVADGLAAKGTYSEQLQAQSDLVQATQEYFDMAQQRYDEGVDNYLTLLDAQRQLLSSRQKLLSDRLLQLDSQVQLYKALGGGWEQPIAESHLVKN
ncbi:major intrinsic multiple antibiotic resistance efflux outer membrane protein [Pseudomonas fluorescens]|uniref:Major intrinsic multiple antibiotic resistance efflux outer membrane protein n=1 Tax=Pseudomonas fluorescens TaxID=294 RepID=A0A379IFF4_PSEFL|nr:efflux transporter outer membrane subunit [Pseudomonas fluorescens]SUD31466.1 major intrinsic multiple antibiotic resistance efflux outer membrane protein [Pseudomonas fluorescens]